jgi:hypothetical protein
LTSDLLATAFLRVCESVDARALQHTLDVNTQNSSGSLMIHMIGVIGFVPFS